MKDIFSLDNFRETRRRITPLIETTPVVGSTRLSGGKLTGTYLKLENLQSTGSFKIRGAAHKLLRLSDDQKARGVIAVSTGNHGRAVAFAARQMGVAVTICLSTRVVPDKRRAIEKLGATIVQIDETYDEATDHAFRLQRERGLAFIHPFDDPEVILGQGTIGLEFLEAVPDLDCVLVPLSGGGLISGVGQAMKLLNPSIRVFGVSMERAPVMVESLRQGKVVELVEEPTLADALIGGLGGENHYTFRLCQSLLEGTILVSEAEIEDAIRYLFEEHRMVVEGGGAVGVAAVMSGKATELKGEVGIVCSGGNIQPDTLCRILR